MMSPEAKRCRNERLFNILEKTRQDLGRVLSSYLSDRDVALVVLGAKLAQINNLSNEGKGIGHLVHFVQIRQDLVDLQILLERLNKNE
jgi:hypothetical protein